MAVLLSIRCICHLQFIPATCESSSHKHINNALFSADVSNFFLPCCPQKQARNLGRTALPACRLDFGVEHDREQVAHSSVEFTLLFLMLVTFLFLSQRTSLIGLSSDFSIATNGRFSSRFSCSIPQHLLHPTYVQRYKGTSNVYFLVLFGFSCLRPALEPF